MSPHEHTEPVSEKELYELFERRRPERDVFRAGIEERVAARRDAVEEGGTEIDRPALSGFRRVAAVLPIDPLGGATAGPAGGKSLGARLVPAALTLPALVLASVFGSLLAGERSLRRSTELAAPFDPTARRRALKPGSAEHRSFRSSRVLVLSIQLGTFLAFVVAWLFGGELALDVLALVIVLSMAALVVTVRSLAEAGLLTRAAVTRATAGLLMTVFVACFLWFRSMRIGDDVSGLGIGWSASTVLLGIVLCFWSGGERHRARVALVLAIGLALFFNTPGITRSSPASLASQWSRLDLDPSEVGDWEEAAAIHGALVAVGAPLPDVEPVRERVARAMQSAAEISPVAVTAAYRMGLVTRADWTAFATRGSEAHRLDRLQGDGELNRTTYFQYTLPMLLATREVSSDGHSSLARKVLAVWPQPGEHAALDRAVMCVHLLDELGRPDLIDGLRERARTLLSEYWVSERRARIFSKVGGFTSNPEKFRTSFDDQTLRGVELMARFGVPDDVDLWLLRSHLRRESIAMPLVPEPWPDMHAMARAALLRLRDEIGLPHRTWLEALLAERLFIATVSVVVLCLLAIRQAPRIDGAQP